jgi:hypothetical protein
VIVTKGLSVKDLESGKFRYDVAPEGRLPVARQGRKDRRLQGTERGLLTIGKPVFLRATNWLDPHE